MLFVNASFGVCGKCKFLVLCGVRVHKKVDHTIVLDEKSFVNSGINLISVAIQTDLDRPLTSGEIMSLRGVWGAMQWKVTQTGPQHAEALSEMQSKISQPTLRWMIKETNKLVSDVKLNDTHILSPKVELERSCIDG